MPAAVAGQVAVRPLCEFWLSSDHRAVDGVISAQYLAALKTILLEAETAVS
jgi:pyruvate/2-oxoglutarate dehydrogenase complex dihydrolipoamide acyltransferase (E2) component